MSTPEALARACAESMWAQDNASRGLGMTLEDIAPGHAVLRMPITVAMANGFGICHGGFIYTLADSAFAFACNSHGERVVASHCSITYLRPGRVGETLTAKARELSRSGRTGVYDVAITDGADSLIAAFRGVSRVIGTSAPGDAAQS